MAMVDCMQEGSAAKQVRRGEGDGRDSVSNSRRDDDDRAERSVSSVRADLEKRGVPLRNLNNSNGENEERRRWLRSCIQRS